MSQIEIWSASRQKQVFTAEDIRQYAYCKRIPYFKYVLKARVYPTVKMNRGSQIHEVECRAKRTELKDNVTRYYNFYLQSESLGLSALMDYFKYDGETIVPVDVKTGKRAAEKLQVGHYLQIVAQSLLVEICFGVTVTYAIIHYTDTNEERKVEITTQAKLTVFRILTQMRKMIEEETIPPPTPNSGKCVDCEYWKVCRRS
jgi:CRISPR-associated exonuclease Cas4